MKNYAIIYKDRKDLFIMPSTATHAYFIDDIYDTLPIGLKKLLIDNKTKLRMFAQSTDPLIFYNLISPKKSNKKIREFQKYFHTNKSKDFFINLTNYIKYNNYYQNQDVMAFLYGFISHYTLDSTIHPFVFFKTGLFQKNDVKTYKYNAKHAYMETFIDNYMIKTKEQIIPYKFKLYNYCFDLTPFSKELEEVIDYTFKETFGITNFSKYYYKSLKDMYKSLKYLRYDKYGIKMFIYKRIDKLTSKSTFKLESISYHTKLKDTNNYLNLNHNFWHNPCLKKETHKESFIELYSIALHETKKIIKDVNSYLKDTKKVNLNKVFKNLSYTTGKNCNNKNILKYFEY